MKPRRAQRGAALLLLLVAVVLAFATVIVRGIDKWGTPVTTTRNVNAQALAQAKAALIGYVAKEVLDLSAPEDVPGRLPCPEAAGVAGTISEGVAAATCTPGAASQKTLGRLPWRTLGIDKLVDGAAEPLWYAVSPNWVSGGLSTINAGTTGQLSFDGTGDVVAVIFAPGRPISTTPTATQVAGGCVARAQARADRGHVPTSTADPDFRDYLECQNASSPIDTTFGVAITGNATNEASNDQAVVITAKELLNAMQGPLAERLQRTVAPLLSEYSDQWISGSQFMPYAVTFSPPEASLALDSHCGTAAQTEGLLPIAATTSATCASTWTGSFTGDGIQSLGCDTGSPVTCSFRYFRFNAAWFALVPTILGANSVTATLQATAPHAAASFRAKSVQSAADITPTATTLNSATFSIAPQTTGDVGMSVQARVNSTNLCRESLIGGFLCSALVPFGLVNVSTATLRFPQLGTPTLAGSKLSAVATNGRTSFDLLAPIAGDPHYWFIQNQWYRYTYYALAPGTSAAQSGGTLTINAFPTADYGPDNNKRFVLALMGPAVTGQTRSATAAENQYVEGDNAAITASPRVFAYQVFTVSGNDRLATCPFGIGSSVCD